MRFLVAGAASGALILGAPYIGRVRHWIRAAFPGHFLLIVGGAIAAAVVVALIAAFARIRDHRTRRYGLIAAAMLVAVVYSAARASGDAEANAVERFHFVEYGLITLLFYLAWRPLGGAAPLVLAGLAALLVGTLDEELQWFVPGRVGVMSDVLLDSVAIMAGLLFSSGIDPPLDAATVPDRRPRRQIVGMTAATLLVMALFFDSVHLGHDIFDPSIGSFTSRYTASELASLSADRAERWKTHPPIDRTRLAREDQYRTEGLQHVQRRNEAWTAGDMTTAWRENQILETFYAPVLDTGHRWAVAQRADSARRVADAGERGRYVSGAYPYSIYTWPRPAFWLAVSVLLAAVGGGGLWREPGARRTADADRILNP